MQHCALCQAASPVLVSLNNTVMTAFTHKLDSHVQDAVFMRNRGEADGALMQRILDMPPSEVTMRVSELGMLQDRVYARNEAVMNSIFRAPLLVQ